MTDFPLLQDLRECKSLTDSHLIAVAQRSSKLEELDISGCHKIGDVGVQRVIQSCVELRTLTLDGLFKVTDASVRNVAFHCPRLQALHMGRCHKALSDSLVQSIKRCSLLRELELTGGRITDTALLQLALHCPLLSYLGVDGCSLLSRHALADFCRKLPDCNVSSKL
jgi:hypothetical protein